MTWALVSQIATAVGALLAAGSIFAAFRIYRITRRDEFVGGLRRTIAMNVSTAQKIDERANYELLNDMASSVVYSQDLEPVIDEMYSKFFVTNPEASNDSATLAGDGVAEATKEDLEAYVQERVRPITTPIRSPLVESYENTLDVLEAENVQYQTDYPGLYRVLRTTNAFLMGVLRAFKALVRNDDIWQRVIVEYAYDEKDKIVSPAGLRYLIVRIFTQLGLQFLTETQPQIDLYRRLLTLVTDRYMSESENELVSISRKERAVQMVPIADTDMLTDDLREAQKGLDTFFSREEIVSYVDIVARIEAFFEKKGKE